MPHLPPIRIDITLLPLTNIKEYKKRNKELCKFIRQGSTVRGQFWPERTFHIETPGMLHVYFEGKALAKDFMERLSLTGVYKKIQMVESSELSINFQEFPGTDCFGGVIDLRRTADITLDFPYETTESETTRRNKRKREMLDDEGLRHGPKRYRKKQRRSRKFTKKEESEGDNALARELAQQRKCMREQKAAAKRKSPIDSTPLYQLKPAQTKQAILAN